MQNFLPEEPTSFRLQVEADEANLFQDAGSWRSTRFLWTALGFAGLMLIGFSAGACLLQPRASQAEPSHLVPEIAFQWMPVLGPTGVHADRHPHPDIDPASANALHPAPKAFQRAVLGDVTGEVWPVGMEKTYRRTDEGAMLGSPAVKALLGNFHETQNRFTRSSTVLDAVLARPKFQLQRQHEPPSPPPPPSGGNGGDGPGGEDDEGFGDISLRRISGPEAWKVLDGWVTRTKVYGLEAQFGEATKAEVHKKALVDLDEFLKFTYSTRFVHQNKRNVIVALYASDKKTVAALAGGCWKQETIKIDHLSMSPLELDNKATADLKMKLGLRLMAQDLGLSLIFALDGEQTTADSKNRPTDAPAKVGAAASKPYATSGWKPYSKLYSYDPENRPK